MNQSFVAMIALLALAGSTSAAGISVEAEAALPTGESHSLELYLADDGGYYVLLDGQRIDPSTIGLPGLPGTPGVPPVPTPAPGVPSAPGVPMPGVPALPGLPSLPGAPGVPAFPTLP